MSSFLYCKRRNTLFCHIEKNGCESLRYLVLKEQNHKNPEKIWDKEIDNYLYNSKNIHLLKKKEPNVILISRDPYSRIISGFNDKILSKNFLAMEYVQKMKRFYKSNDKKRVNFEEFINFIIKEVNVDNHFKPLYNWLNEIKIFKNIKILKLENPNEINLYLKKLNFDNVFENYLDIYYPNRDFNGKKTIHKDIKNVYKLYYDTFKKDVINNNYKPLKKNYFNDELKKKISDFFIKDFNIFNYQI